MVGTIGGDLDVIDREAPKIARRSDFHNPDWGQDTFRVLLEDFIINQEGNRRSLKVFAQDCSEFGGEIQ